MTTFSKTSTVTLHTHDPITIDKDAKTYIETQTYTGMEVTWVSTFGESTQRAFRINLGTEN